MVAYLTKKSQGVQTNDHCSANAIDPHQGVTERIQPLPLIEHRRAVAPGARILNPESGAVSQEAEIGYCNDP